MTDAANTIHIGSVAGMLFAAVFFLIISAAISYVAYALLARPETRRAEFIRLGAAPQRTALIIGSLLGSVIFLIVSRSIFTGFSRIEADGELLRLRYVLPPRTVAIRRDQLTLLEKKYTYKFIWRMAITTKNGQTYVSQSASGAAIEAARMRVAQLAAE